MKVLISTTEVKPFSKTGGLSDVCFDLSTHLNENTYNINNDLIKCDVISPYYKCCEQFVRENSINLELVSTFDIYCNYHSYKMEILRCTYKNTTFLFVKQDDLYFRDNLYGYLDDNLRFAHLTLSIVEYIKLSNSLGNVYDIVQANDWELGFLPLLIKIHNLKCKVLFTIHNPAYQGYCPKNILHDFFSLDEGYYNSGLTRFHDQVCFLKTGIMTADKISTVSKTHREELISSDDAFSYIGSVLKQRQQDFIGITNGLSFEEFNPLTDKYLKKHYDCSSYVEGKKSAKTQLQKELNISFDKNKNVYCLVSRLTGQKGIDKLFDIISLIAITDSYLVILGSGDDYYKYQIEQFIKMYPDNIFFYYGYSDKLAHLIYASSDFIFMPSNYEPCGISQLIAMRYGTVPIVSKVGGLNDTVKEFNSATKEGTGFTFYVNDIRMFERCVVNAHKVFQDKSAKEAIIKNCFSYDSSYNEVIKNYINLFYEMINR